MAHVRTRLARGWHLPAMEREAAGGKNRGRGDAATRGLWGDAPQMGDAIVPVIRRRVYRNGPGFSVLELIVALSMFAIVVALASPHAANSQFALWNANQQLMGDLRRTRGDALTHGDHYRLDVTGPGSYAEYRMKLVGGAWSPSGAPVRTRTLPSGVTFSAGIGRQFEFNTRGLLTSVDAAAMLSMTDAHTHHTRSVRVWPSGQVVAS
jgi:prepilin-type N-terminal cleavage/methylation domain-containing protein